MPLPGAAATGCAVCGASIGRALGPAARPHRASHLVRCTARLLPAKVEVVRACILDAGAGASGARGREHAGESWAGGEMVDPLGRRSRLSSAALRVLCTSAQRVGGSSQVLQALQDSARRHSTPSCAARLPAAVRLPPLACRHSPAPTPRSPWGR